MSDSPTYLVNIAKDSVTLRIEGRASYLNCAPVRKFFEKVVPGGSQDIVIDFDACTNMDSTFLGILAGIALEVRKESSSREIRLSRLSERNLELVNNLGLNRLMTISSDDDVNDCTKKLSNENAVGEQTILSAHESLIEIDGSNAKKFQDVVAFLKKQVDQE